MRKNKANLMKKQTIIHLLRIATVAMFLGRFWEHFRWLGPYRDVFYNPNGWIMNFIRQITGKSLTEVYNDHFYEKVVIYFSKGLGLVFLMAAIVILFYERLKVFKPIVFLALLGLLINYYGLLVGKHFDMWGIFFEHASQFVVPILFMKYGDDKEGLIVYWAQVAISITFISHGLFAAGYYPQPGSFADMMIIGFGLEENIARLLLVIIGWLDFIFGAVLLIPFSALKSKWLKILFITFLWYGIAWGFLTAMARFYVPYRQDLLWSNLTQDLYEVLIRFPHFMVPLFIWFVWKRKRFTILRND